MYKLRTLMYHDVVTVPQKDMSGFPGVNQGTYKVTPQQFENQLGLIEQKVGEGPCLVTREMDDDVAGWVLTFDDGGISAHDYVLDYLDRLKWKAHFFVTTDYIGQEGFLSRDQIISLRDRGHSIGSHSCSHPKMTTLNYDEILSEWRDSIKILSEILHEEVDTAAVPGGHINEDVAQAAEAAGVRYLFTSTPSIKVRQVGRCTVIGRFSIKDSISDSVVLQLARGDKGAWLIQKILWDYKKTVQMLLGKYYKKLRVVYFKLKR